jgi:dTDP-4-amino-4,6-dideoxygalactose transaminase
MLSRVRPYFDSTYINAINSFDIEKTRAEYVSELSKKLGMYYPSAKKFEFFDLGRNSLSIALELLNLHEGDEILIPCFTCPEILGPIIYKNLKPILIEISFDFKMDLDQIKSKISERTKAILVTHFFGIPTNLLEIKEIASEYKIKIIEDCAHAFCSKVDSFRPGSIGDLAFTSFQNDKPLSLGKGSILIINNERFLDRFRTVTDNLQQNTLDDEKTAFLSLLFFHYNTNKYVYRKFIDINKYYYYFKNNFLEVDRLLAGLDAYGFKDIVTNYSLKRFGRIANLVSIFNNLWSPIKVSVPANPQLMNSFSLNLLNEISGHIDEINERLKKNGTAYVNNLNNDNRFYAIRAKNIPYLRYSIICLDSKFREKVKKDLIHNGYEVSNFNWSIPLNKILNLKIPYERCELLSSSILNLPSHAYTDKEDILNICHIISGEIR